MITDNRKVSFGANSFRKSSALNSPWEEEFGERSCVETTFVVSCQINRHPQLFTSRWWLGLFDHPFETHTLSNNCVLSCSIRITDNEIFDLETHRVFVCFFVVVNWSIVDENGLINWCLDWNRSSNSRSKRIDFAWLSLLKIDYRQRIERLNPSLTSTFVRSYDCLASLIKCIDKSELQTLWSARRLSLPDWFHRTETFSSDEITVYSSEYCRHLVNIALHIDHGNVFDQPIE